MAKKQTTKIGVARKRCKGKKGRALSTCMKRVMKGGSSGSKKKRGRPKKTL